MFFQNCSAHSLPPTPNSAMPAEAQTAAEQTATVTQQSYGSGYPTDFAKRIGTIGAASTRMTAASGQNWSVTSQGISIAENLKYIDGLPIIPYVGFIKAEYHPQKREIALHMPNGQVGIIKQTSTTTLM